MNYPKNIYGKGIYVLFLYSLMIYPLKKSYASQLETQNFSIQTDSIQTGIVNFKTTSDTIFVYIDQNFRNPVQLAEEKVLNLKTGKHQLFVFGRDFPENNYYLDIKKQDTVTLVLPRRSYSGKLNKSRAAYARLKWKANLIIDTDSETSIWINEKLMGNGHLRKNLPSGNYRIRLKHISGKSEQLLVSLQGHRLNYIRHFNEPHQAMAKFLSIFPGGAQLYKNQPFKAATSFLLTGAAIGLGLSSNSSFNAEKKEFNIIFRQYQKSTDEQAALMLGNQLDLLEKDIKKYESRRNFFWIAASLVYVLNIYDAVREPSTGWRHRNTLNPFKNMSLDITAKNPGIKFTLAL